MLLSQPTTAIALNCTTVIAGSGTLRRLLAVGTPYASLAAVTSCWITDWTVRPAARMDGYEIRAAAVTMDRPIITTVQELAAAVAQVSETETLTAAGLLEREQRGTWAYYSIDRSAMKTLEAVVSTKGRTA